jgi:prepilin-type N-terminal cleavage/methylation domain-containing protein
MMSSASIGHQRGLTLLELMIVVTLIGILSVVGWSQYRSQLNRGVRGDAVAALTQAAADMEQCHSRVVPNSYASCSLDNMGTGPCSDKNLNKGSHTNSIIYSPKCQWQLSITQQDNNAYTLSASRSYRASDGSMQTDVLTLDQLGRKTGPWPQ